MSLLIDWLFCLCPPLVVEAEASLHVVLSLCNCCANENVFFVVSSLMGSKHETTAYIYCVPIGTSESTLSSVLNNGNQSEYSVLVSELKQSVAVVKILGNGMYYTICIIICIVLVNFSIWFYWYISHTHIAYSIISGVLLSYAMTFELDLWPHELF